VHKVDSDYYTDAMTYTSVRVLDEFGVKRLGGFIVEHGEVRVTRKVVGYKKIKFYTAENVGYGEVNLPEKQMHTTSYWFTVPWDRLSALDFRREELIDGLMGIAYALHHLAAILLMADTRDIDRCIGDKSGQWYVRHGKDRREITDLPAGGGGKGAVMVDAYDPTVFIFDAYPGGIGFSELLFEQHDVMLDLARGLIGSCACDHGCPMCVGPVLEVGPKAKDAALAIIGLMQGAAG
jgi:DEAD/DEAH box helicase domain-containing protein